MRSIVVSAGPYAAASASRFVNAVTPVSGTPLVLATNTVDTVQRRILVTVGSEASPRTLVLSGTNAAGNPISETIAVPASTPGTIISVLDYLTLTSAVPAGGGWTAAMSLGTSGSTTIGSSPWVRADDYGWGPTDIVVEAVGTVNYTVQYSDDDPNLVAPQTAVAPANMVWFNDGTLAAQTTTKQVSPSPVAMWARVTANSSSGTGQAIMNHRQSGGMMGG